MDSTNHIGVLDPLKFNFDTLMDLRVDFAFKRLFAEGRPQSLISLLNAIFANKKIPRIIKTLTIRNPHLEKRSEADKLSILDIRAELEDKTSVLIEMHMYGLDELKAKTIRSWARAYSEELEPGNGYVTQSPAIVITFADGQIKSAADPDKIHRLCMIMDCDSCTVFTDAMELHYIDMKAFARAVNETGGINVNDTDEVMFAKWLSVITHKELNNKTIIQDIYREEEEIRMALSTLSMQGEDKITRQAYQRRQDEIYFHNKHMAKMEQVERAAEQAERAAEQAIAERNAAVAAIAEKDALIAELQAQLRKRL